VPRYEYDVRNVSESWFAHNDGVNAMNELTQLGREGFDLAAVVPRPEGGFTLVLRRETS
jgi:hypothetical protein